MSGSNPDYMSGSNPDYMSGSNPDYTSGLNPDYMSGSNPDYMSGSNPYQDPYSTSGLNPDYMSGSNPDYMSGSNPYQDPYSTSGLVQDSYASPGIDSYLTHGQVLDEKTNESLLVHKSKLVIKSLIINGCKININSISSNTTLTINDIFKELMDNDEIFKNYIYCTYKEFYNSIYNKKESLQETYKLKYLKYKYKYINFKK
jgi:hypothetical protein